MQITKVYKKEIISEVAAMCGDEDYRDFKRELYGQGVYRASRELAHNYSLKEFELEFIVEEFEADQWLVLPTTNFRGEIEVRINDVLFYKVNDTPEKECEYVIKFGANGKYAMNYWGKTAGDTVYVRYVSIGATAEEFDGDPLIPDKHYEELLAKVIVHMAKIGIAKFSTERREKYKLLLQMYDNRDTYDPSMARDDQWIMIKPFNIFSTWPPTPRPSSPSMQYVKEPPDRGA